MKKTFNINVGGFPFIIDEDAYSLLNDYIQTIEHAFSQQEDGIEVVSDIESRIAELLMEYTSAGSPIVSVANVEDVISRIGKPEEMIEDEIKVTVNEEDGTTTVSDKQTERLTPPPYIPPLPPLKKKLYRDPQNSMLGGVCSGLAWYLKADPTMVRLITVLVTIISVATCGIAYLILWIVIPEARSPLERMEMMGEEPTVANIGKTVTDNFRDDNKNHPNIKANSGVGSVVAKIFSIVVKILIIIGMILAVSILAAMIIGFIGCLFALIMFGTSWSGTMFGEISPIWEGAGNTPLYGVICGLGIILVLGIPLFLLVRKGWKNPAPMSTSMKTTLTVLWIIGFVTAAVAAGRILNIEYENELESHKKWKNEYNQDFTETEFQMKEFADNNDSVSSSNVNIIDSIPPFNIDSITSK